MNPEASFDVMVILGHLEPVYSVVHVSEIRSLVYLAQLLSVYDAHPPTDWGYFFAHHEFGGPHSADVDLALLQHSSSGEIHRTDSKLGPRFSLTDQGRQLLGAITRLNRFAWRSKYLEACADAAASRPIPVLVTSMQNEPVLHSADRLERRQLLGANSTDLIELYEHFAALKDALGPQVGDVWLAALLWLGYLKRTTEGRAGYAHARSQLTTC